MIYCKFGLTKSPTSASHETLCAIAERHETHKKNHLK